MPNFTAYNVDVDVDIDVDEFLSSCSKREIKEVINALVEDGHLSKNPIAMIALNAKLSVSEEEFLEKLTLISGKYYSMTDEELEFINNLYNKYR